MRRLLSSEKFTSINKVFFIKTLPGICLIGTMLLSVKVFADDALRLSGIIAGDQPSAIINDQIVSVGDRVGNVQIIAIAQDHVIYQGARGPVKLNLSSSVSSDKQPRSPLSQPLVSPEVNADRSVSSSQNPVSTKASDKARMYLEQSVEYLKQADELLKSPVVYERLYTKAADLCDLADRQAQQVFRFVTDEAVRVNVRDHIDRVRKVKNAILKEKADLATHVRSLIAARQIKTGMSMRDVTSSWGSPLMQNRDGQTEKWVYQDNNGYQKELVFQDGILIGY